MKKIYELAPIIPRNGNLTLDDIINKLSAMKDDDYAEAILRLANEWVYGAWRANH